MEFSQPPLFQWEAVGQGLRGTVDLWRVSKRLVRRPADTPLPIDLPSSIEPESAADESSLDPLLVTWYETQNPLSCFIEAQRIRIFHGIDVLRAPPPLLDVAQQKTGFSVQERLQAIQDFPLHGVSLRTEYENNGSASATAVEGKFSLGEEVMPVASRIIHPGTWRGGSMVYRSDTKRITDHGVFFATFAHAGERPTVANITASYVRKDSETRQCKHSSVVLTESLPVSFTPETLQAKIREVLHVLLRKTADNATIAA